MKVLHVIPSVAPRYGGPSLAVVEMCRALRERGVDTLIATTDADGDARLTVELGRQVSFNDVQAIFFPRQWSEAYKYSRPLATWLDAHVAEFDLVHIHAVFSHASIAAAKACRKKGVPYVVRPLGTLDPWSMKQKRSKKRFFWHFGVKQMLKSAAAIHYTALDEQRLAEKSLGLSQGVVIPLGVEIDSADGLKEAERHVAPDTPFGTAPYVLVLSRLHQKKGLELLLPAFLSLTRRREFSGWKIVLAGEGESEYVALLQRLIEREGGKEHVVFAGWLEGAKKMAALRGASLLALTSYQENFGLCVVEALALGVPVIVSPHVNLAPEIGDAGVGWVAPMEQTRLEETLADALTDTVERERRGALGRVWVRSRFTWEAVAEQLESVYSSVVRIPIEL